MLPICSNCNLYIYQNTRHGKVENGTCIVTRTANDEPNPVQSKLETLPPTADHSPLRKIALCDNCGKSRSRHRLDLDDYQDHCYPEGPEVFRFSEAGEALSREGGVDGREES